MLLISLNFNRKQNHIGLHNMTTTKNDVVYHVYVMVVSYSWKKGILHWNFAFVNECFTLVYILGMGLYERFWGCNFLWKENATDFCYFCKHLLKERSLSNTMWLYSFIWLNPINFMVGTCRKSTFSLLPLQLWSVKYIRF